MGLLSDPNYGSAKWVSVIMKLYYPLCFLCYVASIVWFVMLANKEFNNETYFSENALLPGLVTNEFNAEQSSKMFYNEFLHELEDKYSDTDEMPVPWLVAKMSQLHLEVYTHNFTLRSPLGHGQLFHGTNVYGILRAGRAAPLEALVLAAPYRPARSHLKGTAAGIALMLSFAQFARPQKYWAKDIIFLVTCHEQLGMQAWLEAYHGVNDRPGTFKASLGTFGPREGPLSAVGKVGSGRYLDPGHLKGRSGSIQAAINLEFDTPKIKYIEVKIEGLNGQLPNLDLPNLIHKLCVKSGIHHSFKNSYSWLRNRNSVDEWKDNFYTMMKMVVTQIPGVPSGNHGLFHRYGVEAVTLEGRDGRDAPAPRIATLQNANFYRLGAVLSAALRSLNNLLERFHQSYFFYLQPAINRFVSIGQYMPSLCLLIAAMLIKSLALWVKIQKNPEVDDVTEKTTGKVTQVGKSSEDESHVGKSSEQESQVGKSSEDETQVGKSSEDVTQVGKSSEHESQVGKCSEHESQVGKSSEEGSQVGKSSEKMSEIDKNKSDKSKVTHSEKKQKKKVTFAVDNDEKSTMSIVNIGINYLFVHFLGYAVMNSPVLFSYFGAQYGYKSEESLFYGLIGSSIFLASISPLALRYLRTGPINFEEMALLNVLVLVELATICLCVGMHNISLGLCLGVVYTPLALIAGVSKKDGGFSNYLVWLARTACLLLHPLTIITLSCCVYVSVNFPEEALGPLLGRGRAAAQQLLMYTYVDSMIFGNILFTVATTLVLPVWILFWQLVCNRVRE